MRRTEDGVVRTDSGPAVDVGIKVQSAWPAETPSTRANAARSTKRNERTFCTTDSSSSP
jgi:hypothetical protein